MTMEDNEDVSFYVKYKQAVTKSIVYARFGSHTFKRSAVNCHYGETKRGKNRNTKALSSPCHGLGNALENETV